MKTFVSLTNDSLGSAPSWQSVGATGTECGDVVTWDVTAANMRSSLSLLKESGEMTSAGRRFVEVRSVNGNETRTISPRL